MKKHLDKLWAKAITFIAMLGTAVLFCVTLSAAWHRFILTAVVVNIFSAAVLIVCLAFQIQSAGRWEGYAGIHLTWLDRIPLDLYIAAGAAFFVAFATSHNREPELLFGSITAVIAALLIPTFAARCKAGMLWHNTLLRRLWGLFCILPLLWSTLLVLLVLSAVDLLFVGWYSPHEVVLFWIAARAVLILLVLYCARDVRSLLKGGEKLASGDFSRQIAVSSPLPVIQTHARHLNSIQSGLQKAVEEQIKSERLKTELITNVSHDIKTPLTSIVNYVDLLKKTQLTDPTALEYIAVLERQSQRLRKLTEDLVEASKAATGNISVTLAPTDLNVLLSQVCGEYEQRLAEKQLQMVATAAEGTPHILADGPLLWRVLDNLMSNVCKYAMPGTRVYLSTELTDTHAAVTLKNISHYPLTVSGDELTERFVRGDSARSTEGSGLGLSIAASLTELQHGAFHIHIDGDLFKVRLTFPLTEKASE